MYKKETKFWFGPVAILEPGDKVINLQIEIKDGYNVFGQKIGKITKEKKVAIDREGNYLPVDMYWGKEPSTVQVRGYMRGSFMGRGFHGEMVDREFGNRNEREVLIYEAVNYNNWRGYYLFPEEAGRVGIRGRNLDNSLPPRVMEDEKIIKELF